MVTLPIRLLAVDIDGTLLNPEFQISAADLAALRRAHEEGVEVIVVTGRRHTFAVPIVQQLGFDLWLISSNGAITRSLAGENFHRDLLPAETCRKLCAAMHEFRGNTVLTFDTEAKGAIVLFCGPIPRMHRALAALAASGLGKQITVLRTEYPIRDLSIVDVLNQGCSKGHALERWANHRGIPREQVMAIGDNYNDIEMLAFAGRPFIMGNAAEELRRNGWAVTLSNDQNGVAAAIEQVLGAGASFS